jgi:RNA polymerase sigma-70 factor (ECF subfamily)
MTKIMPGCIDLDGQRSETEMAALLEEIYEEHARRIYSYICHLVGPDIAEDLTQDTFVRVCRVLPHMTGTVVVWPWLRQIAKNLVYDLLRRQQLVRWSPLETLVDEPMGGDPQDAVCSRVAFEQAFGLLAAPQRKALLLSVVEGRSLKDIAPLCGIAPSGAKMYLTRARRKLRKAYAIEAE